MPNNKYKIGIDLGTTNIAMAYCKPHDDEIHYFKIPQLIAADQYMTLSLLPVFIAIMNEEIAKVLPWSVSHPRLIIGEYARKLAESTDIPVIKAPKSWLGHTHLDINQPLLPEGEQAQYAPIEIIEILLTYLADAWNAEMQDFPMNKQNVVVTLPASFNDNARSALANTMDRLGFQSYRLLEEPLAAFYAWMAMHDEDLSITSQQVEKSIALVVDIGGGTTDFSLIGLTMDENGSHFERISVGDHLLLGGENIDLFLTQQLIEREGWRLSQSMMPRLSSQLRGIKERLLSFESPDELPLSLSSAGSSGLFKLKFKTMLQRQWIETRILDGFFQR
ncbi:MAG: Hsp70 family protein [Francisellaceae bacterium]